LSVLEYAALYSHLHATGLHVAVMHAVC